MRGNTDLNLLPDGMRERPGIGKRVVVIGGGDTASDCLRTALRIGAEEVTCLYRRTEKEMPGGKKDRQMAKEEGAKFRFLTQPVKFIAGENGRLAAVECIEMKLGEPDAKGRRKPVPVEDSNFSIAVDTAIKALLVTGRIQSLEKPHRDWKSMTGGSSPSLTRKQAPPPDQACLLPGMESPVPTWWSQPWWAGEMLLRQLMDI